MKWFSKDNTQYFAWGEESEECPGKVEDMERSFRWSFRIDSNITLTGHVAHVNKGKEIVEAFANAVEVAAGHVNVRVNGRRLVGPAPREF